MTLDLTAQSVPYPADASSGGGSGTPVKLPRPVFDPLDQPIDQSQQIYAFPPNRDIMGGTAYLILEKTGNILVDCPGWTPTHEAFLQAQGGVRWLFLTHRGGIGKVADLQQALGCEVVIQEQEAYLLPDLTVTTFHREFTFSSTSLALWTPGHSPGSACLYHSQFGGVLFSGRHLLPTREGAPAPLRIAKTFHWPRQLQSIQQLRDRFTPKTLGYVCPGASTGFLRGQRAIAHAYDQLAQLDLEQYRQAKPLL